MSAVERDSECLLVAVCGSLFPALLVRSDPKYRTSCEDIFGLPNFLSGPWRRELESNRRTRICNPLHDHSAIAPNSHSDAEWFCRPPVGFVKHRLTAYFHSYCHSNVGAGSPLPTSDRCGSAVWVRGLPFTLFRTASHTPPLLTAVRTKFRYRPKQR